MTKKNVSHRVTRGTSRSRATAGTRQPTRARKAETAWELCEQACQFIDAQAHAYYQGAWVAQVQDCGFSPRLQAKNECGTAFCRAGILVGLHDGFQQAKALDSFWSKVPGRASQLIGLPPLDEFGLHPDVARLFEGDAVPGKPGTRAYVRKGVRGLRRFMKQHEAHLRARSLRGL